MADYPNTDTFKLGFALTRLPKTAEREIDIGLTSEMTDRFLEAGGTYFDTSSALDGGESEKAIRKALVARVPRDRYTLSTKLNARLIEDHPEGALPQFYASLERTGAGYFDYYLLNAPRHEELFDSLGLWDLLAALKKQGLIRFAGFTFHSEPAQFARLLDEHPEIDFVQLPINYVSWDDPEIRAHEYYEAARKHGVPVTVTDPVKGGALADLPVSARNILREAAPDASSASWAIRYAASLDGIITVLSGMSSVSQMQDNLSVIRNFRPLSSDERGVIRKAQRAYLETKTIPCTACRQCVPECPVQIPIPEVFSLYNRRLLGTETVLGKFEYAAATLGKGKVTDCTQCGRCEAVCPERLPVARLLRECSGTD